MKKFKKYLSYILLICCILIGWGFKQAYTADPIKADHIMQVVSADMKHERTISWQLRDYRLPSYLEIRKKGDSESQLKTALGEEISTSQGNQRRIYTVRLKNLEAGSEYEYRIRVEEWQSTWRSFYTEAEAVNGASFKAMIFGDSQSINYDVWGQTAEKAWQANQDTAFFINIGDLVDNGQKDHEWQAWFRNAAELLEAIPFSPVMGNHEVYGLNATFTPPQTYLALFAVPGNGPDDLKRHAYSYDYGDIHFVVLNTQQGELRKWNPNLLADQKKWLAQDLAQTHKNWKVVLMHRGVWTNGQLNEIGRVFSPVFDDYQVDLVFSGHTHIYARTAPLKKSTVDSSGTVYITTGRSGTKAYPNTQAQLVDQVFFNPVDMPNYIVLEGTRDSLQIKAYKQDQTMIDQIEIKK